MNRFGRQILGTISGIMNHTMTKKTQIGWGSAYGIAANQILWGQHNNKDITNDFNVNSVTKELIKFLEGSCLAEGLFKITKN